MSENFVQHLDYQSSHRADLTDSSFELSETESQDDEYINLFLSPRFRYPGKFQIVEERHYDLHSSHLNILTPPPEQL